MPFNGRYGIPEQSYPFYGGYPPPPPPQGDPYQQTDPYQPPTGGPRRYGIPENPLPQNPTINAPPAPPPSQMIPPQMRYGPQPTQSSLIGGPQMGQGGNSLWRGRGMNPRLQGVQNIQPMGNIQGLLRPNQTSVGFRNPTGLSQQRLY